MRSFEEFVLDTAEQGRSHVFYERGMYSLTVDLERIAKVLRDAGVTFEVIGGVAVNAHILPHDRSRSFVTRDVGLLVDRRELPTIVAAGRAAGYEAKKIIGGYMLIRSGQTAAEAVHLIFAGERSKSTQPLPHPQLNPEPMDLFGVTVPVVPIRDLVRMKLTSYRPKDLVHLQVLDEVGLIDAGIERELPEPLIERLRSARRQFAEDAPDVE
jgi:hypothetical protein